MGAVIVVLTLITLTGMLFIVLPAIEQQLDREDATRSALDRSRRE